VSFALSPALPGVELMSGRHSERLWKIWHETYTLCLIYKVGDGRGHEQTHWRYRGRQHQVAAGHVMLMEPGEVHITERIDGGYVDFDVFMIEAGRVEQVALELGLCTPIHIGVPSSHDPALCQSVRDLARAMPAGDAFELQHQLSKVLLHLLRASAEGVRRPASTLTKVQVRRAREYIVDRYAARFSLDDLASACGASKSSICHSLPQQLGVTPGGLHSLVRARRAKDLLALGRSPKEVAALAGFADQAQLTRHLKSLWGITPARYARMLDLAGQDGAAALVAGLDELE
jgi:AraC-like DNA-binding protein